MVSSSNSSVNHCKEKTEKKRKERSGKYLELIKTKKQRAS